MPHAKPAGPLVAAGRFGVSLTALVAGRGGSDAVGASACRRRGDTLRCVSHRLDVRQLIVRDAVKHQVVRHLGDALEVRESVAEVTYYLVLARIADDELPDVKGGTGASAAVAEPAAGVRLEGR